MQRKTTFIESTRLKGIRQRLQREIDQEIQEGFRQHELSKAPTDKQMEDFHKRMPEALKCTGEHLDELFK